MNTYRIHALIYDKVLKFSYICNVYLPDKLIIRQYLKIMEIVHWLLNVTEIIMTIESWGNSKPGRLNSKTLMEIPPQLQVSKKGNAVKKRRGWGLLLLPTQKKFMRASKVKNYRTLHREQYKEQETKAKTSVSEKKYHQHITNHRVVPPTSSLEATCSKAVTI